ncbi:MAG: chloramphenicol acetyltransferase [Flavobacteriaceae bacterium]|nr:MAG: chloramphenicol acetyltransferase [Flavobacteriaceae bacterium]
MKKIDIATWERKEVYEFFSGFSDPYFGLTAAVDVTKVIQRAKQDGKSVFGLYLHACIKAINTIENFKYRVIDGEVHVFETINASTTILRENKTFGFSFINFDQNLDKFQENINAEKERIQNSSNLFPPVNSLDCVYCSAIPWVNFTGHKEPVLGKEMETVPKLAYSKITEEKGKFSMTVSLDVNHALIDGYHASLFFTRFQEFLDEI